MKTFSGNRGTVLLAIFAVMGAIIESAGANSVSAEANRRTAEQNMIGWAAVVYMTSRRQSRKEDGQ